jgi:tRNA pseudouridine55 synthase
MYTPETDLQTGRVLLLDKPEGWTSFDAVNKVKRALLHAVLQGVETPEERKRIKKKLKIGHAGTLDPLATGLLVVCTGPKTKTISFIQDAEKEYTGTLYLGATTPSYDREFPPDRHYPTEHIREADILEAARSLTGVQEQYPPAFSALKVGGQRAYELARQGKEVEIKPRTVDVREFTITSVRFPEVDFRVRCSKGTYIRTLAHDLGKRLGSGAYLVALRRTRIGNHRVEDALTPDAVVAQLSE